MAHDSLPWRFIPFIPEMQKADAKHILVVDDEANITQFLTDLLEEAGYRVTTAANGNEAILVVQHEKIDLALVDLLMPEKDGLETIQEISQIDPGVKLITISGWYPDSDTDLLAATLDLYVRRRLTKPFGARDLLQLLEEELAPPAP